MNGDTRTRELLFGSLKDSKSGSTWVDADFCKILISREELCGGCMLMGYVTLRATLLPGSPVKSGGLSYGIVALYTSENMPLAKYVAFL